MTDSPSPKPASGSTPSPEGVATSTSAPTVPVSLELVRLIGQSVEGRPIISYQFGRGPVDLILVGGIHGGYEWNTTLLAYDFVDYFRTSPESIPPSLTIHIIPNANPDGLYKVTQLESDFEPTDVISDTIAGRYNGNGVDLNRNWGCGWSREAEWRGQRVFAGSEPFSEPETRSLQAYFMDVEPVVVLFWHSAANGVFVSGCPEMDPASYVFAEQFGRAAEYPVYPSFEFYSITGDASDWLASQGIPAFTVELTTHDAIDWEQNLAGVSALLARFD
jgi:predicted deacylase